MTDTPIYMSMTRTVRVWQIAVALGLASKDVLPYAKRFGAKSASSSLSGFEADCVVEDYSGRKQRLVFVGPTTKGGTVVAERSQVFVADLSNDTHNNVLRTCHVAGYEGRWWILADVSPRQVGETRYRLVNRDTAKVLRSVRSSQIYNCH